MPPPLSPPCPPSLPSRFDPTHLPHLVALCHDALSPTTQSAAARTLEACESVPGFLLALLALLSDKTVLPLDAARQICAVCVRNSVRRTWTQSLAVNGNSNNNGSARIAISLNRRTSPHISDMVPSQEERSSFKSQLLSLILSERSAPVASLLIVASIAVARHDWPQQWSDLFPTLAGALHNPALLVDSHTAVQQEHLLSATRSASALGKCLKSLRSKKLLKDKKNLATLSEQLLPQLLAPLSASLSRVFNSLQRIAAAGDSDAIIAAARSMISPSSSTSTTNTSSSPSPLPSVLSTFSSSSSSLSSTTPPLPLPILPLLPSSLFLDLDLSRSLFKSSTLLLAGSGPQLLLSAAGQSFLESISQSLFRLLTLLQTLVNASRTATSSLSRSNSESASVVSSSSATAIALALVFPPSSASKCDPFTRLLCRVVLSANELLDVHPISFSASGKLSRIAQMIASVATSSNSSSSSSGGGGGSNTSSSTGTNNNPSCAPPTSVLIACLSILTKLVDLGQKLGESSSDPQAVSPVELEELGLIEGGSGAGLGEGSINNGNKISIPSATSSSSGGGGGWPAQGASELRSLYRSLFGPEVHSQWLQWIVGGCLPLTRADVERIADDGEGASLADDSASRDDDVRKAAEALLGAFVSDNTYAVSLCSKIVEHARMCELNVFSICATLTTSSSTTATLPNTSSSSSLSSLSDQLTSALVSLESAWFAAALAAADTVARDVVNAAYWRDWCVSGILPVMHACGLPLSDAVNTVDRLPYARSSDPRLSMDLSIACSRVAAGVAMASSPLVSALILKRAFYISACFSGVMPSIPNETRMNTTSPLRSTFFVLSLQALAVTLPTSSGGASVVLGGEGALQVLKLAAVACANGIVEDIGYADPSLLGSSEASIVSPACFSLLRAVSTFETMDAQLQALDVIVKLLERSPKHVVASASKEILGPLPALWDSSREHNLVRKSILSIIMHAVESLPNAYENSSHEVQLRQSELLAGVCSLIEVSCDVRGELAVYLAGDALDLWASIAENFSAPDVLSRLMRLFPLLPSLIALSTDHVRLALRIVAACSLKSDPSYSASAIQQSICTPGSESSAVLVAVFDAIICKVKPVLAIAAASSLDAVLSSQPHQTIVPLLRRTWGRLAIALVAGAVTRRRIAAREEKDRQTLLSALSAAAAAASSSPSRALNRAGGGTRFQVQGDLEDDERILTDACSSGNISNVGRDGGSSLKGANDNNNGDDQYVLLCEHDLSATKAYASSLARAWLVNPQSVMLAFSEAAMAHPEALKSAELVPLEWPLDQVFPKSIQAEAMQPGDLAARSLLPAFFALRLIVSMIDIWLSCEEDIGGSSSSSSSTSTSTSSKSQGASLAHLLPALLLNKLLALASLKALSASSSARAQLIAQLSTISGSAIASSMLSLLYSPEWDVAAVSSGRVDGVSSLVVTVEHALESAIGSSVSDNHIRGGTTSREATLASMYFPPPSASSSSIGSPLKKFLNTSEDVENDEDAHLRFQSSSSALGGVQGAAALCENSRQRTFLAQPEIATNLLSAASAELTLLIQIEKERALGALPPVLLTMLQQQQQQQEKH